MNDEVQIGVILSKCFCSYAIYRDTTPQSYSYYGFPSKTLFAFASNVPIVTTGVSWLSRVYEERGVGRVVEPKREQIEEAILQLKAKYATYSDAIDRFRVEWNAHAEQFHCERFAALGIH
jgi:glycosyltransferase involved in cell wall biosynthesis